MGVPTSDKEDVGHKIPGQGPLKVIEQPNEPIGRLTQARKQPAYLDNYCGLLETVQDLDPNSYSQAIKAQDYSIAMRLRGFCGTSKEQ